MAGSTSPVRRARRSPGSSCACDIDRKQSGETEVTIRTLAALLAMLSLAGAAQAGMPQFQLRAEMQGEAYQKLLKQPDVVQALREGRTAEVNERIVGLVPEAKRSAVDYFIASNMLFGVDDE